MTSRILRVLRRKWALRIRPLEAHRALQRLLANPDETEHVFTIIRALAGDSGGAS